MKKFFRLLIISIGTIGILAFIIQDAFIDNPDQPLQSLQILKYFTVQSNLFAVVYFWMLVQFKIDEKSEKWKNLVGGVMIYTTITFIVFVALLEGIYQEVEFDILGNICLHYLNPLMIIGYVVVFRKEFHFTMKDPLRWIVYPVIYLLFLVIWGTITGDFLYPFFQVNEVGVTGLMIMISVMIGLFFLLSFLVVKIVSKK